MLVALGFGTIAVFMLLVMTKRMTPIPALIIVPVIAGLAAGAGTEIGDMVLESIKSLAPTAALLFFAIVFFGIMIDVGLFDPLIRLVLRFASHDPVRVVVGTAVLAGVVSLDGDGSTTFIITVSAMMPVYLRLGLSPVVLTCVAGLANGTMNILPWGGPTTRAASALGVSPSEVFVPMIPSLVAGMVVVMLFAWQLGLMERKRLGKLADLDGGAPVSGGGPLPRPRRGGGVTPGGMVPSSGGGLAQLERLEEVVEAPDLATATLDPHRPTLRPKLIWFNLLLTLSLMTLLVLDIVPIPVLFMVACAIALVVNFPKPDDQSKALASHAGSVIGVVGMVLAAAVLTGVLSGTGMVAAMSDWIVGVIPSSLGPVFAPVVGLLSMPLTFFMSNDAFYFGVLPVLSETGAQYGISGAEMARASITGQPVHMQSPLVPAILLLISLSKVDLGDHHKKVLWRAAVVSLTMLGVSLLTGVVPIG